MGPLRPSYHSEWMLPPSRLGCWTSIQFDIWKFRLFSVFKFVVVLLLVVQGDKVYLPMPPSWPVVFCSILDPEEITCYS